MLLEDKTSLIKPEINVQTSLGADLSECRALFSKKFNLEELKFVLPKEKDESGGGI
jgi:hypothetical protein